MRYPNTFFGRGRVRGHLIKKFRFSDTEVRANFLTPKSWHHFLRTQEIEIVLSLVEDCHFERALEIGSGDGLQSEKIAVQCTELICSDIDQRRWNNRESQDAPENVSFLVNDASDLSRFPENYFDLVYSSNVLEHVEDIDKCLSEIYRVLKPSGLGIHSMPSRQWKIFNSLFRLMKFRKPKIHGVERTNWREFIAFGPTAWISKFEISGFLVDRIYGMPFYFGAGGRYSLVVRLGNRLHLPSSYTFFVRTKREGEQQNLSDSQL